jgi:hypothetical protein
MTYVRNIVHFKQEGAHVPARYSIYRLVMNLFQMLVWLPAVLDHHLGNSNKAFHMVLWAGFFLELGSNVLLGIFLPCMYPKIFGKPNGVWFDRPLFDMSCISPPFFMVPLHLVQKSHFL